MKKQTNTIANYSGYRRISMVATVAQKTPPPKMVDILPMKMKQFGIFVNIFEARIFRWRRREIATETLFQELIFKAWHFRVYASKCKISMQKVHYNKPNKDAINFNSFGYWYSGIRLSVNRKMCHFILVTFRSAL